MLQPAKMNMADKGSTVEGSGNIPNMPAGQHDVVPSQQTPSSQVLMEMVTGLAQSVQPLTEYQARWLAATGSDDRSGEANEVHRDNGIHVDNVEAGPSNAHEVCPLLSDHSCSRGPYVASQSLEDSCAQDNTSIMHGIVPDVKDSSDGMSQSGRRSTKRKSKKSSDRKGIQFSKSVRAWFKQQRTNILLAEDKKELKECYEPYPKVGGRLILFPHQWQQLTSDPWILETVQGYKLELTSMPEQVHHPVTCVPRAHVCHVDAEVNSLLEKGAITEILPISGQFVSTMFLVPEGTEGWRPKVSPFHLERDFVRVHSASIWNCQCTSGVHKATKTSGFAAPTPRHSMCNLHRRLLILGRSFQTCQANVNAAVTLLLSLGFLVNWEKSKLVPKQEIQFLGMVINSQEMTISLPQDKVNRLQVECQSLLHRDSVTVRCLSKLLGKMTATLEAVTVAPLHYRSLQKDQLAVLSQTGSYDTPLSLSLEVKEELKWWMDCLGRWNGRSLLPQKPEVILQTDASKLGRGALCVHNTAQGQWSVMEQKLHINQLEMLAVFKGLDSLVSHLRDVCVEVK
ncbi:uncharacterized protein [Ptychodera flava]|uniref:uncharacterized protein n=1 Tax=Ptychodera flava TaxID=63121 RepID=UPI00396A1273